MDLRAKTPFVNTENAGFYLEGEQGSYTFCQNERFDPRFPTWRFSNDQKTDL